MIIKDYKISDISPYDKNPRKNDDAVPYVMESIREFGFKVPIVIDKNNIIVTGHTRYKAAKKLGFTEVPCIKADDLTDEQIKAFRLADNKVGEQSAWDFDLLDGELGDILDIDMEKFDFTVDLAEKKQVKQVELKPYNKVHYLLTLDLNDNDKIIPIIDKLKKEGVEIDCSLN